jgi:hypothetical protein
MKSLTALFIFIVFSTFSFAQSTIDYVNYFNQDNGTDLNKLNQLKSTDTIFVIKVSKVCVRNYVVILDSGEVRNVELGLFENSDPKYTFEKPNKFHTNIKLVKVDSSDIIREKGFEYSITYTQGDDGLFNEVKNEIHYINGVPHIKTVYDIVDVTDINFVKESIFEDIKDKIVVAYVE